MSRKLDNLIEDEISRWTFEHFWRPKYEKFGPERIRDKQRQLQGIDVQLTLSDGRKVAVDEKAKYKGYNALNGRMPAIAHEVLAKNQYGTGDFKGWFMQHNETHMYATINPFAEVWEYPYIRETNMTGAIILLTSKRETIDLVSDVYDRLVQDAQQLREDVRHGSTRERVEYPGKNYYLLCSKDWPESPINLIIRRDDLLRLNHSREIYLGNAQRYRRG